MTGKIGNINKKENSTNRDFDGVDITFYLKDNCSIINPVLVLNTELDNWSFNYIYINQFSRYYFIRDVSWVLGNWEITCECDVLASWKDEIRKNNKYVLRSSIVFDTEIIDTLYPSKVTAISKHQTSQNIENWGQVESFVIGTISKSSYSMGTTTYYVCTHTQAKDFFDFMLSGVPEWDNIDDFSGDVAKAFIDPFQYVVSCLRFPFSIPEESTTDDTIKFGFWDSGISARALLNPLRFFTLQMQFPDSGDSRVFTNYSPFAEYWLDAGVFGIIPLQRNKFESNTIFIKIMVDLINGNSKLRVDNASDINVNPITVSVSKVGSQLSISGTQLKSNISLGGLVESVLGSAIGATSSLISGGDVLSGATSNLIKAQVSGQNEGVVESNATNVLTLMSVFYNMPDEDLLEYGRPCFKNVDLTNITGYFKLADGEVSGDMTVEEQRKIKNYLEGGFYLE